jgi:hypothetical protein
MSSTGKIVQLVNPTNNQDAATKSYVDTEFGSSGILVNRPTVQRDDASNNTHYLTYISSSDIPSSDTLSKRALMRCDNSLTYNPNTNTLTAGTFSGSLSGNASTAGSAGSASTAGSAGTAGDISKASDSTFTVNGTERMRITSAGRVGIGTSSPVAPLEVSSVDPQSISGTGRFWDKFGSSSTVAVGYNTGTANASNPDITNVSIVCTGSILIKGSHLWVTSDQRIKTNIVNLKADKMINVFRNLRPISFDFIDPMKNYNKKHFGFIAQEVNEVLPEGISFNTDVIPNNLMKADIAKPSQTEPNFTLKPTDTDITLQYLLLTTDTPLIFDISNSYSSTNIYKFKIYGGEKWTKYHDIYIRSDYNVTDDKYTYVIGMKKDVYDVVITEPTLFVYGQYVNDLHILEHDTIYTVATAALQEVDRQQQADKARIAELEATVAAQQSLINDILERLKTLEKA